MHKNIEYLPHDKLLVYVYCISLCLYAVPHKKRMLARKLWVNIVIS